MSIRCMSWAWSQKPKKSSHKVVLLAIADNSNDSGICFPKLKTISQKSGISVRSVQRAILSLKEEGYIKIEHRNRKDNGQSSNLYHLNFDDSNFNPEVGIIDLEPQPYESDHNYNGEEEHIESDVHNKNNPVCPGGGDNLVQGGVTTLSRGGGEKTGEKHNENKQLTKSPHSLTEILTERLTNNVQHVARDGFNEFWDSYPIKKNKKAAHEVWVKNKLHNKLEEILSDIKIKKTIWKDPKFIPHPFTYLRYERWEDEMEITLNIPNNYSSHSSLDCSHKGCKEVPTIAKGGLNSSEWYCRGHA